MTITLLFQVKNNIAESKDKLYQNIYRESLLRAGFFLTVPAFKLIFTLFHDIINASEKSL